VREQAIVFIVAILHIIRKRLYHLIPEYIAVFFVFFGLLLFKIGFRFLFDPFISLSLSSRCTHVHESYYLFIVLGPESGVRFEADGINPDKAIGIGGIVIKSGSTAFNVHTGQIGIVESFR
jgi:hypothetical protein